MAAFIALRGLGEIPDFNLHLFVLFVETLNLSFEFFLLSLRDVYLIEIFLDSSKGHPNLCNMRPNTNGFFQHELWLAGLLLLIESDEPFEESVLLIIFFFRHLL